MRSIIYFFIFALLVGFGIWHGLSSTTFVLIVSTLAAIEVLAAWVMFFVKRD